MAIVFQERLSDMLLHREKNVNPFCEVGLQGTNEIAVTVLVLGVHCYHGHHGSDPSHPWSEIPGR